MVDVVTGVGWFDRYNDASEAGTRPEGLCNGTPPRVSLEEGYNLPGSGSSLPYTRSSSA